MATIADLRANLNTVFSDVFFPLPDSHYGLDRQVYSGSGSPFVKNYKHVRIRRRSPDFSDSNAVRIRAEVEIDIYRYIGLGSAFWLSERVYVWGPLAVFLSATLGASNQTYSMSSVDEVEEGWDLVEQRRIGHGIATTIRAVFVLKE